LRIKKKSSSTIRVVFIQGARLHLYVSYVFRATMFLTLSRFSQNGLIAYPNLFDSNGLASAHLKNWLIISFG